MTTMMPARHAWGAKAMRWGFRNYRLVHMESICRARPHAAQCPGCNAGAAAICPLKIDVGKADSLPGDAHACPNAIPKSQAGTLSRCQAGTRLTLSNGTACIPCKATSAGHARMAVARTGVRVLGRDGAQVADRLRGQDKHDHDSQVDQELGRRRLHQSIRARHISGLVQDLPSGTEERTILHGRRQLYTRREDGNADLRDSSPPSARWQRVLSWCKDWLQFSGSRLLSTRNRCCRVSEHNCKTVPPKQCPQKPREGIQHRTCTRHGMGDTPK